MADSIVGIWKLEISDNFDAYLKEIGVNWAHRQAAVLAKITLTIGISDDGKHMSIKQESSLGSHLTEFDFDQEFDEKTPDGRRFKSKVKMVDNKLIHSQIGNVNSTITRYVDEDGFLVTICEANSVTAVRKFKRLN